MEDTQERRNLTRDEATLLHSLGYPLFLWYDSELPPFDDLQELEDLRQDFERELRTRGKDFFNEQNYPDGIRFYSVRW